MNKLQKRKLAQKRKEENKYHKMLLRIKREFMIKWTDIPSDREEEFISDYVSTLSTYDLKFIQGRVGLTDRLFVFANSSDKFLKAIDHELFERSIFGKERTQYVKGTK